MATPAVKRYLDVDELKIVKVATSSSLTKIRSTAVRKLLVRDPIVLVNQPCPHVSLRTLLRHIPCPLAAMHAF